MKKIIVFMLVMALCVTAITSCGKSNPKKIINDINEMYANSAPTKVVATTKQTIASVELNCSYSLVNGYVNNDMAASVYTEIKQELESVENGGATEVIKPLVKETKKVTEAIEGVGSRNNGGSWDSQGSVDVIKPGAMAINLDEEVLKNVKYENNVLTFTIPKADVAKVLGKSYSSDISSDVKVTIVDDGAQVTSIELRYNLNGNEELNLPESQMVVKVEYTYDLETITIS